MEIWKMHYNWFRWKMIPCSKTYGLHTIIEKSPTRWWKTSQVLSWDGDLVIWLPKDPKSNDEI
jgi:hypothetical protein